MLHIKWCKIVLVRVLLKSRTSRVCRRERLVVRNWLCCGAGKSNICRVGGRLEAGKSCSSSPKASTGRVTSCSEEVRLFSKKAFD